MKRILIIAFLLIFLSEGTGTAVLKKLNIEKRGPAGALGFAVILGLLQTLYYIPLMLNLSFTWIIVLTGMVLLGALLLTMKELKNTNSYNRSLANTLDVQNQTLQRKVRQLEEARVLLVEENERLINRNWWQRLWNMY